MRPCEIHFESDVRGIRSFFNGASGLAGHRAVERLPAGSLSRPGPPWAMSGQPQFIHKWVTWPIGKLFMYILPLTP